jgi:short-subunit dehydrogenase
VTATASDSDSQRQPVTASQPHTTLPRCINDEPVPAHPSRRIPAEPMGALSAKSGRPPLPSLPSPGSWAFVTGGSKGLGFAYARAMATRGFNVALSGTSDASAEAAVGKLTAEFRSLSFKRVVMDLSDTDATISAVRLAFSQSPFPAVVILNAGIELMSPADVIGEKPMRDLLQANCVTTPLLARYFLGEWVQRGVYGVLLGNSSIANFAPISYAEAYSSSRAFQSRFFRLMATRARKEKHAHVVLVEMSVSMTDGLLQTCDKLHLDCEKMLKTAATPQERAASEKFEKNLKKGLEQLKEISAPPDEIVAYVLAQAMDKRATYVLPLGAFRIMRRLERMGMSFDLGSKNGFAFLPSMLPEMDPSNPNVARAKLRFLEEPTVQVADDAQSSAVQML